MLLPLKPIPIKERLSVLYVERCQLDVLDGAFVAIDVAGVRTHIPVGGVACLMLEPGVCASHAACKPASQAETLLVWVGEAGVRLRCRDIFRCTRLLEQIIPDIEAMLTAGGLEKPVAEGVVDTAIPNPESLGDAGRG